MEKPRMQKSTTPDPAQKWTVKKLLILGQKEGVKGQHLKAVPVLILAKWVSEERVEGEANYVWSDEIADRLTRAGLAFFEPKGRGIVLSALVRIQNSRNLQPTLIEYQKNKRWFWINLPKFESLLQEYRLTYETQFPEDYRKLWSETEPEPDWGMTEEQNRIRSEKIREKPEMRVKAQILLSSIKEALDERQQIIDKLTRENKEFRAEQEARAKSSFSEISFIHTSPDFPRSAYREQVTSIKDTIAGMLKRAEDSIRISTRQMDMFVDKLIALKRSNPNIKITVLSRGPQRAEGDRKRLAGRKFEDMKDAGVNLLVEPDELHSRLVIVDEKEVLVSSADLDYTQMEAEFNAGIWTNNPKIVTEAIRYFDNILISLKKG